MAGTSTATAGPSTHPSGDKRFVMLEAAMRRQQYQQSALIEVLHAAQQLFGYLDLGLLHYVARRLKLPLSKVYGVATFYHLFRLKPPGRHTCVICTGTACYVKGADRLLEAAQQRYHIGAGETTPDGELSLVTARCLGACGIAPAIVLDDVVHGFVEPDNLLNLLEERLVRGSP
ncbi:MAG: bidirectional hydrogenase complex protein HoxE [Gemmatales bacterium]|nr:bidirectional hydrogenase complex protein HoxE [Gemmatales bacterium]MDW8385821.1 bidirectional hydrogenase complex protein HoxE [Gemmatales bacterium]